MREGDLEREAGAGREERLSESDGDELPPSGDRKEMETGEREAEFSRQEAASPERRPHGNEVHTGRGEGDRRRKKRWFECTFEGGLEGSSGPRSVRRVWGSRWRSTRTLQRKQKTRTWAGKQ